MLDPGFSSGRSVQIFLVLPRDSVVVTYTFPSFFHLPASIQILGRHLLPPTRTHLLFSWELPVFCPTPYPFTCPSFIHNTISRQHLQRSNLHFSVVSSPFHNSNDEKHHQHVCLPTSLLPMRRHARHQLSLHPLPAHPVHRLHLKCNPTWPPSVHSYLDDTGKLPTTESHSLIRHWTATKQQQTKRI